MRVGVQIGGLVIGLMLPLGAARGQLVQTFYVPLPDEDMTAGIMVVEPLTIDNSVFNAISISSGFTNTVITYDHWEDGFEPNIIASATTRPLTACRTGWGSYAGTSGRRWR